MGSDSSRMRTHLLSMAWAFSSGRAMLNNLYCDDDVIVSRCCTQVMQVPSCFGRR